MNFYKKINTYLLERFPTMWNTQFVWMILICLLTHILYYGLGYGVVNIEMLKKYGVNNTFFRGGYFSFYLIIGLLSLIFFGMRYFAHNPFKHFYPLSHTYFWKILMQLGLIFLLFFTVFISFENGMRLKAKKIAPIETVWDESEKIELAKPFLYNQISEYKITSRSYPEPFPCEDVSNVVIGRDTINDVEIKHNIDSRKPNIYIGGLLYQFGKTSEKKVDSCNTVKVIDTIYDVSKIYGIAEYSLYNYNGDQLGRNRKYIDSYDVIPQEKSDLELEKIHNWNKNKDSNAIAKTIQVVKDICSKYKINEQLSPMKMATAGLKQDLNIKQLIRTGFVDFKKYNNDFDTNANSPSNYDNKTDEIKLSQEISYNYYANLPEFTELQSNVERLQDDMGYNQLKQEIPWILIMGSLLFALLFIAIKYIPLKDLIIGIFIAGVHIAIISLYEFITYERNYDNNDRGENTIFHFIIYSAIVIAIGLYAIYTNKIRKIFSTKWFISLSVATLAFLPLLLVYTRHKMAKEIIVKCSNFPEKIYPYELQPWQFILSGLFATGIIFSMLRKLYSKVE